MTQKAAVYQALVSVMGVIEGVCLPTKEERACVNQILFEGFRSGEITLDASKKYSDKELKQYVSGLQSNWLRKDGRLNGDVKYVAKNPGSRAGSSDSQIKAMRMLMDKVTDKDDRKELQEAINARQAEIKPAKAAELTADQVATLIEAGLEHLIPSQYLKITEAEQIELDAAAQMSVPPTKSDLVDELIVQNA